MARRRQLSAPAATPNPPAPVLVEALPLALDEPPAVHAPKRQLRVVRCAVSYTSTSGTSRRAPEGTIVSDMSASDADDLVMRGFLEEG